MIESYDGVIWKKGRQVLKIEEFTAWCKYEWLLLL